MDICIEADTVSKGQFVNRGWVWEGCRQMSKSSYKSECWFWGIWCFSLTLRFKIPKQRSSVSNASWRLLVLFFKILTHFLFLETRQISLPWVLPGLSVSYTFHLFLHWYWMMMLRKHCHNPELCRQPKRLQNLLALAAQWFKSRVTELICLC